MKKIIAMLMALVMMMSLAACGAGGEEAAEFSRGVVEGNVYTSEYSGLTFTAPEGFRYYSDEEIATVNGITEELLDVEEIETVVYDMYCIDETNGSTININFENIGALYGALLDEEAYLDLSLENFDTMYASSGITITSSEIGTIDISGKEFTSVDLVLDFGGVSVSETLFVKEIGGNMMCCAVAAADEATIEDIISCFEAE